MIRKFITASFLIHCLVLGVITREVPSTQNEPLQDETEVELYETEKEPIRQIKELSDSGDSEESTNFYWGLGITISMDMTIASITPGYNADLYGLQVGDKLLKMDGKDMSFQDNDITGPGPRKMLLTILRKSVIMDIQVERGKVYY